MMLQSQIKLPPVEVSVLQNITACVRFDQTPLNFKQNFEARILKTCSVENL